MTRFFKIGLLGLLMALACSGTRLWPHFVGQDAAIQDYVKEFKDLAATKNIVFSQNPTIGLESMSMGNMVGRCYKTLGFREIAVDSQNWAKATSMTRKMLAFHELTHCYCGRDHDLRYMPDGCPASLMAPEILTDDCAILHQTYYTNEMFDRCKPYK